VCVLRNKRIRRKTPWLTSDFVLNLAVPTWTTAVSCAVMLLFTLKVLLCYVNHHLCDSFIYTISLVQTISTLVLTPWSRVLEKLTSLQLVKKFPAFYGTRRFFTVLTSARAPTLSQPHPVLTTPSNFLKIRLNIIFPSTSVSPQWSLSLWLPHQHPVHTSVLPTCPAYLILIDFTTRTILGKEYRSFSSSLCISTLM
jgi:hypothetical protein